MFLVIAALNSFLLFVIKSRSITPAYESAIYVTHCTQQLPYQPTDKSAFEHSDQSTDLNTLFPTIQPANFTAIICSIVST